MRLFRILAFKTIFFCAFTAHATLELTQDPSTHLRASPMLNPVVQERLFDDKALFPNKLAWTFGIGVEVPVLEWLNSGILIHFNLGLPEYVPVIDMAGLAKFQWPIAFSNGGNVAPYVMTPLGISYTTAPVIPWGEPLSDTKLYKDGVGFNGALLGGVELFPIRYFGLFAEAGYKASILFHQIVQGKDEDKTWKFAYYWIRGVTFSFGAKIAF